MDRSDAAANGQLIALEFEHYPTEGKILLLATANGVGGDLGTPPAIDCFMPVSGVANDVSLSQDARFVAWSDDQGLKVAGTPVSDAAICPLSSPPVVIAAAGESASIGGADVAAFLPPRPGPPPDAHDADGRRPDDDRRRGAIADGAGEGDREVARLRARRSRSTVGAAGKVTISGTVPAKTLGRKGKPIVVATGSATAKAAGNVTIKLKLNATGRKQVETR